MFRRTILGLGLAILLAAPAGAQDRSITIASTTSTEQSGLFGHILPIFTRETGIQVRVVALGTVGNTRVQSGYLTTYALWMLVGVVGAITWVLF